MNLTVLRKTRPVLDPGDIFVMQPPDGAFLYGRVIAIDASIGPIEPCILIYVYRARSNEKSRIPELVREQLLVPPIMTNRRPWTMGYFEPLEKRPLQPVDRLSQHCFKDSRGWYFDENSNRLAKPIEPVGTWGLDSFRTIDDAVSTALGIPLAPD